MCDLIMSANELKRNHHDQKICYASYYLGGIKQHAKNGAQLSQSVLVSCDAINAVFPCLEKVFEGQSVLFHCRPVRARANSVPSGPIASDLEPQDQNQAAFPLPGQ